MDLRDFESIVLFLSEEEIDELQAAIDERRMERLAREGNDHRDSEVDLAITPNREGEAFYGFHSSNWAS